MTGATESRVQMLCTPLWTYAKDVMDVSGQCTHGHTSEILLTHNGTTSYLTVYGSIQSSGNLGSYSTAINNANVELYFTQSAINSSLKLSVNLL